MEATTKSFFLLKIIQVPAKSMTEEDIVYFRDFLHIEKPMFHGLKKSGNTVTWLQFKLRILE